MWVQRQQGGAVGGWIHKRCRRGGCRNLGEVQVPWVSPGW